MKIVDRKITYADEWEFVIEGKKEFYRNLITNECMFSDEFEDKYIIG